MDINNFPDKLFTKKQLLEKFFPAIHKSTLERYMRDINKNDDFKDTNLLLFFLITTFSLALIFATIMTI